MQTSNMVQRGYAIYLFVKGEWYTYDLRHEPLGSGAMGTVYLGRSCSHPDLYVAIKKIARQYADIPSIRERAHLEGGLMFRHRHLIEMIGICEYSYDHGPLFIVSKLVQGINLDAHVRQNLKNRPTFINDVCKCIYPVLDALEYLHSNNIFHLDIKPSNIMVENESNIRLMDLGIASSGTINSSKGTELLGTPQYAAPEQFGGSDNDTPISGATDIYEAGVTLYELLSGVNPYDAPSISNSKALHRNKMLPYVESVPKEIVDVLRIATAVNHKERYSSASKFKEALQMAVLESERPKGFFSRLFCY